MQTPSNLNIELIRGGRSDQQSLKFKHAEGEFSFKVGKDSFKDTFRKSYREILREEPKSVTILGVCQSPSCLDGV